MAQQIINGNTQQPLGPPNEGLGADQGDTWNAAVKKINANFDELYTSVGGISAGAGLQLADGVISIASDGVTNAMLQNAQLTLGARTIALGGSYGLAFSDLSGNITTGQMNSGSGASSSTFWRGDGTWATPSASGTVTGPVSSTSGDLASFNGTSGTAIQDSGIAASNVALLNAFQTYVGSKTYNGANGVMALWQITGSSGFDNSIQFSLNDASGQVGQIVTLTNDVATAQGFFKTNSTTASNINIERIPNATYVFAGGTSCAGLFLGTDNNSAPVVFFTSLHNFTNKRGQIGGVSGGWAIGDSTADAGPGTVTLAPQTFATLPAASAGLEGAIAEVNDSTTAAWGATITGGGTNKVLAHCNGAAWTVFGA